MKNQNTQPAKILIIDDDRYITKMLALLCETRGYMAYVTHSTIEAREILWQQKQDVNLIILDLLMPHEDGKQFYKRLQADPQLVTIPVIILSAVEDVQERVRLMEMGVDDYIVKPFQVEDLMGRMSLVLELGRLRLARRQAEVEAQHYAHYLTAINQISYRAAQYLDLPLMMIEVVQAITDMLDLDGCAFYLIELESYSWRKTACLPEDYQPAPSLMAFVFGEGAEQSALHGNEVAVMIRRDEILLGALVGTAKERVTETVIQLLETLAVELGVTITNTYLVQDLQQSNQELKMLNRENERLLGLEKQQRLQTERLHQMGQVISSSLDINTVLASTIDSMRAIFQVEHGFIILVNPEWTHLIFAASLSHTAHFQTVNMPIDKGIVGQVIRLGNPLNIANAQTYSYYYPLIDKITNRAIRSVLCVPLTVQGRIIGAIQLLDEMVGRFSELDLSLLSSIAASVSIAIDNANLYQSQATLMREIQQSQAQLVQSEKMAATGRLAASLAHEINNPLQAIQSCLQLVTDFKLADEAQQEYLRMASGEVERLGKMVARIVDFARPSSGRPQLVHVHKILGEVMQLADKYSKQNNWTIQQVFATDVPPLLLIPDQMGQVFLSILLNAFDAMSVGDTLRVTTRLQGKWVEIIFKDSGTGMVSDVQARVFEPFFTTKENVSGLGLAISYLIVERHAGRIEVVSELGKGSVFTVRLPRHTS